MDSVYCSKIKKGFRIVINGKGGSLGGKGESIGGGKVKEI
jgi:hypothetical protein